MYNFQVLVFSSLALLLTLLLLKSYFSSKSHKNLPPSPPKLPLIGNLHQLGSGSYRNLQSLAQTYGPLMCLYYGTRPVVVASSVDAAKEILKNHDITFANRPSLYVAKKLVHDYKDIAFSPYGEYWRQARSIAVLHLLNNKRVQSYEHVREDELMKMIKKIQEANNSVIDLTELIISYTHHVLCRVAFGKAYDGHEFKVLSQRVTKVMIRFSFENFIPQLAWLDRFTGLYKEADLVAEDMNKFYGGIIDEHPYKREVGVEGQDFLDILFEIQRDNTAGFRLEKLMIQGIIQNMVFGGSDSTATSLQWAMGELIQCPRAMKEVQQEARNIGKGRAIIPEEDIDKMPYLKAVVKEAMRLHFPNPLLLPHMASKDVKVLGYDIPSGTNVLINGLAIAKDPSIWDEPEKFRPERFLNTNYDYLGLNFEYLPFGAGRRGCPGTTFAVVINEFVLANLVYKFDFASQDEKGLDLTEDHGITLHMKYPMLVKATPYDRVVR